MQIESEQKVNTEKVHKERNIQNYALGDLNTQKVLIYQRMKNQNNQELFQRRNIIQNQPQKQFLTKRDILKQEIFKLVQEKEQREYFDSVYRSNISNDAKRENWQLKMRKVRTNIFHQINYQIVTLKLSKIDIKSSPNFSNKLQNYITANKIQFDQQVKQQKFLEIVRKLYKLIKRIKRDKIESFNQIKLFISLLRKGAEKKNSISKMQTLKPNKIENFIRKGDKVNLISLDDHTKELYKMFYEITHDVENFQNFYKLTLENNYQNNIRYLEEVPFYLTHKELLEKQIQKFDIYEKDSLYQEKADNNQMEIETDEEQIEFDQFFQRRIYDPITFDKEGYTKEDQYNLTNQFFIDELKDKDIEHCIIQKSSSRTSVFQIHSALKQDNFVSYFETNNKFKIISSDQKLKNFKQEIPEIFQSQPLLLFLIYYAMDKFRNYKEIEYYLLNHIFIINTGINQDMLKNLIIYLQYLTGEQFGEIQNKGYYIESMIEEKNQFLGQKIQNDFKENFLKFKQKIQQNKPEEYQQILQNVSKYKINKRIASLSKITETKDNNKKSSQNKQTNMSEQIENINSIYRPFYNEKTKTSDFQKNKKIFLEECDKYEEELTKKYIQLILNLLTHKFDINIIYCCLYQSLKKNQTTLSLFFVNVNKGLSLFYQKVCRLLQFFKKGQIKLKLIKQNRPN